jgi:hypothetical protein
MPKNFKVNAVSSLRQVYAAFITYPGVDPLNITNDLQEQPRGTKAG